MTIKCLVVDDEELARILLETFIGRLPNLQLVGKCKNAIEAIAVLQKQTVDLLFLDIQMPELTGIEFLKTLQQKPLVIFTTAYPDYAIEGYALDVTDYLLKPFSFQRFVQAVNKASEILQLKAAAQNNANNDLSPANVPTAKMDNSEETATTTEKEKDYILVKSEHRVHRLKFDDIHYIQSMREYVAFYTPQGRILSLYSLKQLEKDLPTDRFMRIHKSYIVAIDQIKTLEGNMLDIGKKESLPIGASYREEVLGRIF